MFRISLFSFFCFFSFLSFFFLSSPPIEGEGERDGRGRVTEGGSDTEKEEERREGGREKGGRKENKEIINKSFINNLDKTINPDPVTSWNTSLLTIY